MPHCRKLKKKVERFLNKQPKVTLPANSYFHIRSLRGYGKEGIQGGPRSLLLLMCPLTAYLTHVHTSYV